MSQLPPQAPPTSLTPPPQAPPPPEIKNPCLFCCEKLSSAVRTIAILQIGYSFIVGIIFVLEAAGSISPTRKAVHPNHVMAFSTFEAVGCIVVLIFSIVLLMGANKRSVAACRSWLFVHLVVDTIHFGYYIQQMVNNDTYSDAYFVLIGVVLSSYTFYVVYCFLLEIRLDSKEIGGKKMIPPSAQQPTHPNANNYSQVNVINLQQEEFRPQQEEIQIGTTPM